MNFQTIKKTPEHLGIDLYEVRSMLSCHASFSDQTLSSIVLEACEYTESKTGSYIIPQEVQMCHQRNDVLIRKGPVQKLLSIEVKQKQKWKKIFNHKDGLSSEERDKIFIQEFRQENNSTSYITILNYPDNQHVRLTYRTGYSRNMEDYKDEYVMPYSIKAFILARCQQTYRGDLGNKEFRYIQESFLSSYNNYDNVSFL